MSFFLLYLSSLYLVISRTVDDLSLPLDLLLCHFGRRIGIGSISALAIVVGSRLGLGVGDAVHRDGDAGMGGG